MKTLVCRCEDVTLHELEAAMERGYRDIESVKRYTGFGTGWCQGKWCLALCAKLIHDRGGDVEKPITPRPPFHPVSLAVLAGMDDLGLSGGGEDDSSGR
jgi:bacterioferritin-associated ferredoxin